MNDMLKKEEDVTEKKEEVKEKSEICQVEEDYLEEP